MKGTLRISTRPPGSPVEGSKSAYLTNAYDACHQRAFYGVIRVKNERTISVGKIPLFSRQSNSRRNYRIHNSIANTITISYILINTFSIESLINRLVKNVKATFSLFYSLGVLPYIKNTTSLFEYFFFPPYFEIVQ